MLQKGHDLVKGPIVSATIKLRKHDHVLLVVRHCFICEIQVYNFLDWAAEIADVFDVFTIFNNCTLTTKNPTECLHVGVKGSCDFFNEATFLISKEDKLIVLRHLGKENTQSRSLHDFEADTKL